MATIDENLKGWRRYDWKDNGDEWSEVWGGTDYLWYGTIFPRIRKFFPVEHVLEIAPGYGRCTQYLLHLCKKLTIVDLTEKCIQSCQKRFIDYSHIHYVINDGMSLEMVDDDSLDFVFSWDSLVHAEKDVLLSYLKHLTKKLRFGGVGFIHHSNLGALSRSKDAKFDIDNTHHRAQSMTASLFREYCQKVGLNCVSQEVVNWGGKHLIDCLSLFAKSKQKMLCQTNILENVDFMGEAHRIRRIKTLYEKSMPLKTVDNETQSP